MDEEIKVRIGKEITVDMICDEYNRIKQIEDKKQREEELQVLKILSRNIGGYLGYAQKDE